MTTYEEVRDLLSTGDLVLFSGRSFFSLLIRVFTNSAWSHVGMVVRLSVREADHWPDDFLALWESTTLTTARDLLCGCHREGVQLVGLSKRLCEYRGRVVLRRLSDPLTDQALDRFAAFRREVARRPYERSLWQLLGAATGWNRRADLRSVFCSELVAESYQRLGLLGDNVISNRFRPGHFAGMLPLQGNTLGEVMTIRLKP